MYFPYIRGRQYELLALKELISRELICDKVIPILEPVKFSSTLINTITEYVNASRKLCVILNPCVGNFLNEYKKTQPNSKEEKWRNVFDLHCRSEAIIPSLIMNIDAKQYVNKHDKNNFLVIHADQDFLDDYNAIFSDSVPKYTLIPDERAFRRNVTGEKVIFSDKFSRKMRNADYAQKEDEPFSDEHLFFKGEGYAGFSDYSVIGNDYVESGFAPYAVAIHIVYFNDDGNIRVRHFVSNSNDDIGDPAKKFYEALTKL